MSTKYFALLTNIGAAKLAKATALGMQVEITQMAVGDGNDALPTPDPAQTALAREIRRAPLNVLTVDPLNTSQIIAEQVIPEDVGGWWIREIGLFDKDGDMVAIANCAETYKPQLQEGSGRVQVIRMILIVSSTQAVTLKIDPAVVLATRQYVDSEIIEVKGYVDDKLTEHAQSRNHPDATLTDKGFVQLSSATGSTDETKAATPKAVKAAMDNANKRQPGNENLTALSSLAGQPDKLPYFTNKGAMSLADFATFMRTMLSKTDAASVLEYLGLKETVERATNAVQKNGDEMTGSLTLRSDDRMHFVIANADGSVRAFIYKDKGGDGIRINNGADGGGEFVLNKDGGFYAPSSLHIGNAWIANDGNIFGTRWDSSGAWLWEAIVGQLNTRSTIDYVNQTFVRGVRAGYKETSQVWRGPGYSDQWPFVITGVYNPNQDDLVDNVDRRPLQHNINGVWYNIDFL
ncbi:phage tail protein [Salmonella enterica subsp. enterica serovar Kinondoni]|nr:phage tail protein [Salmonella enterica subsp. enterica serovar Kinondoni]